MERCPNCGQMGRPGARFCTICGYRIADDAGDGEPAVMEDREPPPTGETNDLASGATSAGWPAPPADDQSPGFAAWTAEIPASDSGETAPSTDEAANEEYASVWSARSGDDWPSPPATNAPDTEQGDPTSAVAAPPSSDAIAVEVETISEPIEDPPLDTDAQERAMRLLDEARGIIATMSGASPLDLSGVIAELEVAVTPPGAINADDLSDLREALLAARERPRDLDTIVDLTARIDAMVALVFAYDRAIAAIERALDVLRRG